MDQFGKNNPLKINAKVAKYPKCQENFAFEQKRKALPCPLLFALQLTYIPRCINRITTETRSSPGFPLFGFLDPVLKEQAQGIQRKQTSPSKFPGPSSPLPPSATRLVLPTAPGRNATVLFVPLHLLSCGKEAALGHGNLVSHLGSPRAPGFFPAPRKQLTCMCPWYILLGLLQGSPRPPMLFPGSLAQPRGEGGRRRARGRPARRAAGSAGRARRRRELSPARVLKGTRARAGSAALSCRRGAAGRGGSQLTRAPANSSQAASCLPQAPAAALLPPPSSRPDVSAHTGRRGPRGEAAGRARARAPVGPRRQRPEGGRRCALSARVLGMRARHARPSPRGAGPADAERLLAGGVGSRAIPRRGWPSARGVRSHAVSLRGAGASYRHNSLSLRVSKSCLWF